MALIGWTVWGSSQLENDRSGGLFMPYVITREEMGFGTDSVVVHAGWHAAYLLGLCLLALAAALLHHRPRRWPAVLGAGVLAVLLTAVAGSAQLP